MKKEKKKKNFINDKILTVVISVIFGLIAGLIGALAAGVFVFEDLSNIPFFGEINFSNSNYNGSNLVIRDAKKVIVEQDTKIIETINSVNNSVVGIYKKLPENKSEQEINNFELANYYKLDQPVGLGIIVSSDGWIATDVFTYNISLSNPLDNYVIITKENKIYNIDSFVKDTITSFLFIHVDGANDFPVRQFVEESEIKSGQLALIVGWRDKNLLSRLIGKKDASSSLIKNSDVYFENYILSDSIGKEFYGATVFDLSGNIIGLVDGEGNVIPVSHFISAINSLFKNNEIKRPSLGVNYIDLSDLISANKVLESGVIIYKKDSEAGVAKNSSADLAGLKEGDIIISIDNKIIDNENNLTNIIQSYLAEDEINIVYLREGEEKEIKIILGEIK